MYNCLTIKKVKDSILVFFLVLFFVEVNGQSFVPTRDTQIGLRELSEILEAGEILDRVLTLAAFYMLFSAEPDINKVYEVSSTDWEQMGKILVASGFGDNTLHN